MATRAAGGPFEHRIREAPDGPRCAVCGYAPDGTPDPPGCPYSANMGRILQPGQALSEGAGATIEAAARAFRAALAKGESDGKAEA